MRFTFVGVESVGLLEGIQSIFYGFCLPDHSHPHQHRVIHKLLVCLWFHYLMRAEPFDFPLDLMSFKCSPEAFYQQDEKEGREWIPLP